MGPVQVVGQDGHRHGITEEEKAKGAQGLQQRMRSRHRNNQENSRAISYKTAINWCHQIPLRNPGTVRKSR